MIVTEVKTVDYVNCTPENPFQLMWLNSLGGTDTWVFSKRQEHTLSTEDMDEFEPVINYLQVANSRQQILRKDAYDSVKLGYEQLSTQQVNGIKEVLKSQYVVWVNGTNQIVVVVRSGSFKLHSSDSVKHSLEFEVILPKLYTVSL
jgi:hypothetical protein